MSSKDLPMKKAFSSLDLAVIIKELKDKIVNSYIDNVYNDAVGSLILKLRNPAETLYLLLKPAERLHVTKTVSRLQVSGKTSLFRRYLNNLKVRNIKQVEFERIAVIELEGRENTYNLYVELIPRGIASLVDSEDRVLITTKELKVKDRKVIIGRTYTLPPIYKDFRVLSVQEWFEALIKYDNLQRGLIRGLGIPPEIVNEVLKDSYEKVTISEAITSGIRDKIVRFVNNVIENPEPVIITKDGNYVSFLPFKPTTFKESLSVLPFESFNEAVDEYFLKLFATEVITQDSKSLNDELARIEKLIVDLKVELNNYTKKLDELKTIHDIVSLNYNTLEEIYRCVWDAVKKYGWEHVNSCGTSSYDRSRGTFIVNINGIPIELNVREGVNNYLIKIKMQIKDFEDKIKKVNEVIEEALSKRSSLLVEKESLSAPPISKKVDWYDKYHWIITSEGYLALGGRDSSQNEKLVRKYLNDDDIFMHADIVGAPVFILKSGGGKTTENTLFEVATLAACYSKGWKEGFGSLDVFWVYGRQVSKKAPAGEYLAPGSFMIYGEKNYIRNVKLELALGISIIDDKYYKVLVGPEDYIFSKCKYYVLLCPGTEKKEIIAKKLVEFFVSNDKRLRYVDLNELVLKIPGPSRVSKLVPK
ncbi:MAG: ribosome rescue protein RqcH [Sulfolobales archaeon]